MGDREERGKRKTTTRGFDSIPYLPRGCIVVAEFCWRRGRQRTALSGGASVHSEEAWEVQEGGHGYRGRAGAVTISRAGAEAQAWAAALAAQG
jgi:hypothetical protein